MGFMRVFRDLQGKFSTAIARTWAQLDGKLLSEAHLYFVYGLA